ncbi:NADP-dependent glyceraldehyde-3-phosphate dehydrogenase, putative [Ricinus communis]|uniref:NADP-dependent glyceraldehyde-3-phosphate dehydrogenase n=1 Tax=Ricinus communis TaxID=3988 RepID=B9T3U1_RICCO|nr:NADP-dependent glyceraldehyde-3-phosphate dehydrogenase, putative [Ricinus communis]
MELAKSVQKAWARTPLWKRAELLHKAAAILKEHKAPITECLVKEIAKPAKDAFSEVVRYGDLISYIAVEGVRSKNSWRWQVLGLISCVTGNGFEIGDFLTMHPGVNCISFIGGDTSIAISKKAGMIPLQMEFGGKDACIAIPGRC